MTAALDAAANQGIAARHHRLVGSWGSMVDHLVVSPNGLWVVIDQPYPEGKVERRDVGDWFTPEPRLFVGDKDRSDVTRRVNAIDESVGAVLAGSILADVPRYRVVCFFDAPPGWFERPFPFDDVWITWSRHIVEPMLATRRFSPETLAEQVAVLDRLFPPI